MNTKLKKWIVVGYGIALLLASANHVSAFYNPSTGRWLSRDPIGELGSVLLRHPDFYGSSGADAVLGIDLRAIERKAMQTAWSSEELQLYAFNQNDGINFIDRLGLMRIQDLLAKLEARKKANTNKSCCCNLPIGPLPAKLAGVSLGGATVLGYYDKQFADDFFNSICILQPEIYWWDCYSASEEGGWSWNWGDYGWSGPGSTRYSKTATPDAWSMRDPYHLAMASLYVWDACENGKRVTKWKAAGGIQWTWNKKTKQWTGPDPVKE